MFNGTHDAHANDTRRSLLDEVVANAEKVIDPNALPTLGQLSGDAINTMFKRFFKKEIALETPWASINEATGGGLWPGLHVLVSSTGSGKTQFALQLAIHAAQTGRPVVYVALELGRMDIVARALAYLAIQKKMYNVKWSDLVRGKHDSRLPEVVLNCTEELCALPFHVEVGTPRMWPVERIKTIADAHQGALVVLDYMQLVGSEQREDMRQTMGRAAYALRAAARDQECTVLAISSISRAGYGAANGKDDDKLGEGDPARYVGMGKESGDIEFASDSVIFLGCEKYEPGQTKRRTHVAIAKNRVGGSAWARLVFVEGTRFEDDPDDTGSADAEMKRLF